MFYYRLLPKPSPAFYRLRDVTHHTFICSTSYRRIAEGRRPAPVTRAPSVRGAKRGTTSSDRRSIRLSRDLFTALSVVFTPSPAGKSAVSFAATRGFGVNGRRASVSELIAARPTPGECSIESTPKKRAPALGFAESGTYRESGMTLAALLLGQIGSGDVAQRVAPDRPQQGHAWLGQSSRCQ